MDQKPKAKKNEIKKLKSYDGFHSEKQWDTWGTLW